MIKIYSTPSCPWCVRAKEYLDSKGISYKEINVASNMDEAREMIEKSGQRGVPVLDINGDIVIGFDKNRIDYLIQYAN